MRSMPSAAAASGPRTTAGYRAVAASRKVPRASRPCSVRSRLTSAEYTVIALVFAAEIRSFRYTWAFTSPMAEAPMTGPIRATMAGAEGGSVTV